MRTVAPRVSLNGMKLGANRVVPGAQELEPLALVEILQQALVELRRLQPVAVFGVQRIEGRSEEHTSELQSPMRISYAVFCLKKKTKTIKTSDYKNTETSE